MSELYATRCSKATSAMANIEVENEAGKDDPEPDRLSYEEHIITDGYSVGSGPINDGEYISEYEFTQVGSRIIKNIRKKGVSHAVAFTDVVYGKPILQAHTKDRLMEELDT